jgi:hypothetical protein
MSKKKSTLSDPNEKLKVLLKTNKYPQGGLFAFTGTKTEQGIYYHSFIDLTTLEHVKNDLGEILWISDAQLKKMKINEI